MSSEESLTIEILRQIRDETAKTRTELGQRIEHLEASTNERLSETNRRLDFLADGQVRLHTEVAGLHGEVAGLRGEVVELRGSVDRQGDRFEHFLHTQGDVIRDLKDRVGRIEDHVGLT